VIAKAANGVVLSKEAFPYTSYGISHFKEIDFPGVFWGKSTTDDGIGHQKAWNETLSDVREFNRTMAKGKWTAPKGSKMEFEPDDTHGEIIWYKPVMGHKPDQINLKSLPPTVDKIFELAEHGFNQLYSQHEVTQGTNRSDLRSGEMVALLREQDAHGNIPSHAVFEESLEEVMTRVLRRIKAGYTDERVIQLTGKDNQYETFAFKGADLRDSRDVKVKRQSGLPDSRTAREAIILERYKEGLYGDPANPETRRVVINMLEDAVVEEIFSDTRLDERIAQWENHEMLNAQTSFVVNDYDDHKIHLEEHNKFLKNIKIQKLRSEDPQAYAIIYGLITEHRAQHIEFLEEQRTRMLQEAQAMRGRER
jgi:hypothetical protein